MEERGDGVCLEDLFHRGSRVKGRSGREKEEKKEKEARETDGRSRGIRKKGR